MTSYALYVEIMSDEKIAQHFGLKFPMKHGKSSTRVHLLSTVVYGDVLMSRSRVFECHSLFIESRNEGENEKLAGRNQRPSCSYFLISPV